MFRSTDAGQHWVAVPEMLGDPVYAVAVTAADPAEVFAATYAGLMKSSNRGETWTNLSPFPLSLLVAVSPSNAEVVYTVQSSGPKVSTDGGVTFGSVGTGLAVAPITALRVDPQTPTTVYASLNSNDGVYKSVDAGAHWSPANHGLPGVVYSLEIDPVSGNTIYAVGQGGVYKSTDGGGSWGALNLGTPIGYAYSLAINRSSPSMLFAATANGLFRSADGGSHWTALALTFNVSAVAINTSDGMSIVASADYKNYRSTDGGATVQESSVGLTAFQANAIVVDPNDSSTVYAGGPQGIFQSGDYGRTWSLTGRAATALAIDAADSKTLYLLFLTALYRSSDGGITWDGFSDGLPGGNSNAIASAPGIHGRLYAISGGTIYRRDGEGPWTSLTSGLPENGVAFIAFDPSNGQSVFAASSSGLFKSVDGGNTWSAATLPAGLSPSGLAVDPFDARHQFVWSDASLYVTSDGGANWASVDTIFLSTVVFDRRTRGLVYLNSLATLLGSVDGGKTWARFNYGLGPISGELLVPAVDGTLFKGGVNGGVYVFQFGRRHLVSR